MDNNDNGTNAASSENNNSQFVMYWANNIARIVPNTADDHLDLLMSQRIFRSVDRWVLFEYSS